MKSRRPIVFLLLAVGIVVCVWLIYHRRESQPALKEEIARAENQPGQAGTAALLPSPPPANNAAAPASPTSNAILRPSPAVPKPNRAEQITAGTLRLNVPINFYGKVVDQKAIPVAGASIRLKYREYLQVAPNVPAENNPTVELATDANGRFELTGVQGDAVSIEDISKSGYQLSGKTSLSYAYAEETLSPDPSSPVIFKLWKKQGADRLVTGDKFYGVVPDGRVYTLDLLAHKKTEGGQDAGDLKVSVQRPEKADRKTKFDWSFSIDGISGGVIESPDDFLNLAPETGYQAHYQFRMVASNPDWVPEVTKQFYIQSRDGKIYSRITVEVIPDYKDKSVFSVKYFVNPTGSRNLEYDSRQLISTDNFFPPQ
jgi:hypothetical protein